MGSWCCKGCCDVLAGMDVVLNSLSEEKLQASLRLLAQHGRFLEIGKFDLSNNTALGKLLYMFCWSLHRFFFFLI